MLGGQGFERTLSQAAERARSLIERRARPAGLAGRGPGTLYRRIKSLEYLLTRDRLAVLAFLAGSSPTPLGFEARAALVARFIRITNQVRAYHTQTEMLSVARRILALAGRPGLTVVEAGAGKGASTAKLSLVARASGAKLIVFDSFRGIPENDEVHQHLDGRTIRFRAGAFTGRLRSVERVVRELGALEVCELRKGWFEETLPALETPVDVALLDVDLLSSTRTCLIHLMPRLRPGGAVFTQDGHLRAIVDLLASERFWRDEVGIEPPRIEGLGREKLLCIERTTEITGASSSR